MGFSPAVKEKAMVACARHCCVCHRYKGVKIEVHHIVQEANGGPDTFENAIPLCFDCHSDAGHYNNNHPKGTKFSIPELRNARDTWYQYVRDNPIVEKILISEHIQTAYYVLHNLDTLEELILKNDFSLLNKFYSKIYLTKNHISKLWKDLLLAHRNDYRYLDQTLILQLGQFKSIKEFEESYDNIELIDKTLDDHPYYEARRIISWGEVIEKCNPNSFLKILRSIFVESANFGFSYLHANGETCGGEAAIGFTEYIEIPPISFAFLGITNASNEPIKLNYFEALTSFNKETLYQERLPNFNILPRELVLTPVSMHINIRTIDDDGIVLEMHHGERSQMYSRVLNANSYGRDVTFVGPYLIVENIVYNDNKGEYQIPVHKLDFSNLYSINRNWECGSCPHLFYVLKNGDRKYCREILKSASEINGMERLIIPHGVTKIMICELERETTFIQKIEINNRLVLKDKVLTLGDKLLVDVSDGDIILINGFYSPMKKSNSTANDMWYRNKLIEDFLHSSM